MKARSKRPPLDGADGKTKMRMGQMRNPEHRKSRLSSFSAVLLSGSILAAVAVPGAALAQSAEGASTAGEIIVTARKRNETAIDVPAAITALDQGSLEKYGTKDFWGLQNQVPGLMIQDIPSSGGGAVALRGMASSPNNPAIDQTVAINIDGVQVGAGQIIRLGQMDLQQVEVLKGPQALFFGKNSPAGVISMRSADPGDKLEVKGSVGYEFNAHEIVTDLAVGGPISDTLGIRVAGAYNKMRGWLKNTAQVIPGVTVAPPGRHSPDKEEIMLRGTLVWKPDSAFSARLKYNYSHMKSDSDIFDRQQRIACPYGAPQTNGIGGEIDCKADDVTTNGGQNPNLIEILKTYNTDRVKFHPAGQKMSMQLASLELNYELVEDINLTSVSGYFKIKDRFGGTAMYQSMGGLVNDNPSMRREVSQEIRLASSKEDWPVNFAVGAYYQDTKIFNANMSAIDAYSLFKGFNPAFTPGSACAACSESDYDVNGTAKSIFGQLIAKPFEQLEIAGGVRYSEEKKDVQGFLNGVRKDGIADPTNPAYAVDHVKFKNTSPEVTIRYRPNQSWTIFGAWRNGFKSGGFNTGNGSANRSITVINYRPEKIQGFEAGIKYAEGPFRANLTAYTYKYKDLQVATFDPISLSQRLINAAGARIKGFEGDFTYRTPIDGLEIRGSFNYNKARYTSFLAGCYAGQLITDGCNLTPNPVLQSLIAGGFDPNGAVPFPAVDVDNNPATPAVQAQYLNQNLKGRPLVLAPDWTATIGFSYETAVGTSLKAGLGADLLYSSAFFGQLEEAPQGKQKEYANLDATIFVGAEDGTWRLSLIGRNLTDVYRARFVSQTPLTGIASRGGTNIAGGLPDFSGNVNRGREVRVQASFRF
jgi:iron complex outermembrane receptor protein